MRTRGILILAALYLGWPLYQVIDYILGQPMAGLVDNLNFAASILSYNWLLLNVLLGLKIPVLQRQLPYDFRIRAHVVTTLAMTAFVAWHGVYYGILQAAQISVTTWGLLAAFAGILGISVLWIPLPGLKKVRQVIVDGLRFGILKSYDALKAVHKVLFVALAGLAYLHILEAHLIGVASPASSFGFQFLFLVAAAAFLWTKIQNLVLPTLEVVSIVTRGDTTRLSLAGHPRFRYRSGQFAFLRFQHPELQGEEHPFSFVSAAHERSVEFAVRGMGDFTKKLSTLKAGDKVRVNGGFGAFRPRRTTRPLALVGSGIGAAPLVSIVKDLARHEPDREVVCVIAAPSRSQVIDLDRLEALQATMPRLTLRILASDEGAPRFSQDLFREVLGDAGRYDFYLCSSDQVRKTLLSVLSALGVRRRRIHYEAFSLG
jgi:ferredoxin-NADP reductase